MNVFDHPSGGRLAGAWFRTVATIAGAALVLLVFLFARSDSVQAASSCQASGPSSGSYTVTVCITQPADGSVVSGALPVTVNMSTSGNTPSLNWFGLYLDGGYFTMAATPPYQVTVPTAHYVDGLHALAVEADMSDHFNSSRVTVNLVFANGVTSPPVNTNTFKPAFTSPASGQPFVLAATGDGAAGGPHSDQVSGMVQSWNPNLFMYLGDVYLSGSVGDFYNWYGQSNTFYGRLKGVTSPTIGNHEYETGSPAPYIDYWNNAPHYYSYNAAGWHFISLDNTFEFNQYSTTSPQYQWLVQDLTANSSPCTLVYFHRPVYGASWTGGAPELAPWWNLFAQRGVKAVLSGHEHDYQRWQSLNGSGTPSANGVTEFVVGTGGWGIDAISHPDSRLAVGLGNWDDFGALRFDITSAGAAYKYVQVGGSVLDQGTIPCSTSVDSTPPTSPAGLTGTSVGPSQVNLSWSASTDDTGVTGYTIYRNGSQLATVGGTALTYSDTTVAPGVAYTYTVDAFDAAGNHSKQSSPVSVTTTGIGFVQAGSASTGGRVGSTTITFSAPVKQGDLLAGWFAQYDSGGQISVSDNVNGTWTRSVTTRYARGSGDIALYYLANSKSSGSGLSVTISTSSPTYLGGSAAEYSGVATASPLDQAVLATGSSASADSGATAAVGSGELLFGGLTTDLNPGSVTAGSSGGASFQLRSRVSGNAAEDILSSTAGPQSARFTLGTSVRWYAVGAAFRAASASADTQAPSVPSGVSATASSPTQVDLSWSASTDNVGVTGYTIYRGGVRLASVSGSALRYSDTSAAPSTTYTYTVDAFDAAGNHSAQSSPVTATTPATSGGHIAFVRAGAASTGSRVSSATITLAGPVAQGELLVGWFGQYDSTGQVSVSDNINGAWTRSANETFNNGRGDIALYYMAASGASPGGLTITISAANPTYLQGSAAEYSTPGVNTLDQVSVSRGSGLSASAGPTSGTPGGELVFGAITTGGSPGTLSPGSSQGQTYSVRASTASGSAANEDILSSAAGTQSSGFTLGSSTDWYMAVATFRAG